MEEEINVAFSMQEVELLMNFLETLCQKDEVKAGVMLAFLLLGGTGNDLEGTQELIEEVHSQLERGMVH